MSSGACVAYSGGTSLEERRVADQRVQVKDERAILCWTSNSVMFEVIAALAISF